MLMYKWRFKCENSISVLSFSFCECSCLSRQYGIVYYTYLRRPSYPSDFLLHSRSLSGC